jgi:hypothetical protein
LEKKHLNPLPLESLNPYEKVWKHTRLPFECNVNVI